MVGLPTVCWLALQTSRGTQLVVCTIRFISDSITPHRHPPNENEMKCHRCQESMLQSFAVARFRTFRFVRSRSRAARKMWLKQLRRRKHVLSRNKSRPVNAVQVTGWKPIPHGRSSYAIDSVVVRDDQTERQDQSQPLDLIVKIDLGCRWIPADGQLGLFQHHRGVRLDAAGEPDAGADHRVVADHRLAPRAPWRWRRSPRGLRSSGCRLVPRTRLPSPSVGKLKRAERHALIELHVVADLARLADHHARAVIDEEVIADRRARDECRCPSCEWAHSVIIRGMSGTSSSCSTWARR